ncbi:MAG: hypothetical protein ACTHNM_17485 [Dyella sp.]|uniref:hypothetical protein n=1 Tax=Dyella sp. TaxID=1869338 RepID=UPI003F7FEFA3
MPIDSGWTPASRKTGAKQEPESTFQCSDTKESAFRPPFSKVRAYSLATGKELWSDQAQAPAVANPAVYEYKGREYMAFVAGGSTILKDQVGGQIVVYALPRD